MCVTCRCKRRWWGGKRVRAREHSCIFVIGIKTTRIIMTREGEREGDSREYLLVFDSEGQTQETHGSRQADKVARKRQGWSSRSKIVFSNSVSVCKDFVQVCPRDYAEVPVHFHVVIKSRSVCCTVLSAGHEINEKWHYMWTKTFKIIMLWISNLAEIVKQLLI